MTYNELRKLAETAKTPEKVCNAINKISEANVYGYITDEENDELIKVLQRARGLA